MARIQPRNNVLPNPEWPCPPEILEQQVAIEVTYVSFDGPTVTGTMEVNKAVAHDVKDFFQRAALLNFPIEKVAAASDSPYKWNDDALMEANVSSGFNYRLIAGADTLSLHSKGLAFDVNPRQNPYIRIKDGQEIVAPSGAMWRPDQPGTL